jgi:2-octaprenyl-6-methoxyphenol hydroxylase
MKTPSDVTIIGAGLVGCSFALALPQKDWTIQILEHHLPEAMSGTPSVDTRPITLSYSSTQILKTLGLWDDLEKYATPIQTVHVSQEGAFGSLQFEAHEYGVPALGYVLPHTQLQQQLYHHVNRRAQLEFISTRSINQVNGDTDPATLHISTHEGERTLASQLIIAADGTHSTLRKLLNIPAKISDPQGTALTLFLELEEPHQHIAYERFTDQGTLAILPLAQPTHCRAVWSTSQKNMSRLEQLSDDELRKSLEHHFRHRLNKIKRIERGKTYPLHMQVAEQQIHPHCVLLGNAAHTLFPFAAQGFNLGLRDAASLSEILVTAKKQKRSFSSFDTLTQYESWVKSHQTQIIGITKSLSYSLNAQWPGSRASRGLGLLAIDLIPSLKLRLGKRLLGLSGRLPALALGRTLHHD